MIRDRGLCRNFVEGLFPGYFGGVVYRSLHQPHRYLGPISEFSCQFDSPLFEFACVNDFVHESELEGFIGLDDLFPHDEIHRPGDTHVLDEQILTALVRQQSETKRCAAHPHTPRRDTKIARQRQREPGLNGDTVDGRDGQFIELANGGIHALRNGTKTVVCPEMIVVPVANGPSERLASDFGILISLEIVPCAKSSSAAGEHDDPNGVVHLGLGNHLHQISLDGSRHAVESFRCIELNPGDPRFLKRHSEALKISSIHLSFL